MTLHYSLYILLSKLKSISARPNLVQLLDFWICRACLVSQRVMPSSAYALARYWLRVDGVLVRVIETRIWARFEDGKPWLRETTWREASFAQLGALGLSTDPRAYANPDAFVASIPIVETSVDAIFIE